VFKQAELVKTVFSPGDYPPRLGVEFSFAGRSNVGKSTLLNVLLGVRIAHVSGTPGKTGSVNFYKVDGRFYFVDLPGYGYARRSRVELERWRVLVEDYFAERYEVSFPIVLIDIRHPLQKADITMLDFLRARELPFVTVLTKSDKLSASQLKKMLSVHEKQVLDYGAVAVFPVSAISGKGISELKREISSILGSYSVDRR